MDVNNWRLNAPGGEPSVDDVEWRTQMPPDSRKRIVNKIMQLLKRLLPLSGQEELKKIAVHLEEKIYAAASSQPDYLRKISLNMLNMENKSQNIVPNSLPANSGGNSNRLPDTGASHSLQSQVHTRSHSIPSSGFQLQAHQQLPSQNIQPTSSMLQQHQHSVPRQQQAALIHQQQPQIMKQPPFPSQQQQQQQLMGQQSNVGNMQQSQLIGQQNSMGDMQQQQRLLSQHNHLLNLQQQLMDQHNKLSTMHQQQLGPQNNVVLQQQQLLGSQSGTQGQQSQSQPSSQQLMSQMQSLPTQLQRQPNPAQHGLQQRLQASGQSTSSLVQSQSVIDQQTHLYQSQRTLPNTSSTSLDAAAQTGQANVGDWQEEVYQKVRQMKDAYLPEMTKMYQKVASVVQKQDSLPQQAKSDQLERLKIFKGMVERMIQVLQMPKISITPALKDKLGTCEKQILSILNTNRPRKPVSSMQQGFLPHVQSLQQSHSQDSQLQSHENHVMQSMNLQGSTPTMSQSSMSNLQDNSLPSVSWVSSSQQQCQVPQVPANSAFSLQRDNTEHQLPTLPPPPKQPTLNCPICFGPFIQETSTKCGHIFCKTCLLSALEVRPECPTCRRRVLRRQLIRVFLPAINCD